MSYGFVQLVLAGFWLMVGVGVLLRNHLAPGGAVDRVAGGNADVVALLAFGMAAWNGVRWFMGRAARPSEPVIVRRPVADRPFEYNPELDFTRSDERNGQPPASGG